jgi:hypothetical protein
MNAQKMTIAELIAYLANIDYFVSNLGLTYSKGIEMNKYLDFRENGKANPNPYYDAIEGTFRLSNLQTGFEYDSQLGRKYKAEGIVPPPIEAENSKKPIWYSLVSVALAKHKTKDSYYFRYQDHNSSYLATDYTFNGQPIDKALFEAYTIDTSTDYSKYQNGLQNPTRVKVLGVEKIKRLAINKEVFEIVPN